jgi:hypothetical protein
MREDDEDGRLVSLKSAPMREGGNDERESKSPKVSAYERKLG